MTPFPYRGEVPDKNRPFLDVADGERRGHSTVRGGTYWEDQTYSDQRVLLHIPKGFDPRRPALMVVFFHGNEATLARDVRDRQAVPRQVAESGLNAVLVAPQFAVNALDSSAGRFWEPGVFAQFVREAGERLTQLYGDRARAARSTARRSWSPPIAAATIPPRSSCTPAASTIACAASCCSTRSTASTTSSWAGSKAPAGLLRQHLRQGVARGERDAATHADRAWRALSRRRCRPTWRAAA